MSARIQFLRSLRRIGRELALAPVHLYRRAVSPLLAPRCRYYPTCSAYAVGAVREHGIVRGTGLALWRVVRCNPWSCGGVDHVPPRRSNPSTSPLG